MHVNRDLIRERDGQDAVAVVFGLQRTAKLLVASGKDAQQRLRIRHAPDGVAERHRVPAADPAGHNEIDLLILRQAEHRTGRFPAHGRCKFLCDRHTGNE